MPPPFKVQLVRHDPAWADGARREGERLRGALGHSLLVVHHIGSTSIPGIRAKPILDLMPVVRSLTELDGLRNCFEALGYEWLGEYGLPGRRYCTQNDPASRRRLIQLHCYEAASAEIERHLAFRDYLRDRPDVARVYEREKLRCQALNPESSHAYGACKNTWIDRIEAEAMNAMRG